VRFVRRHLVKTRFYLYAGIPRGQGLIEFELILPALLLLVVSIIDFGRLIFTICSVTFASRDAVRYGASIGTDIFGITYSQDRTGIRKAIQKFTYFPKLDVVIPSECL
jgi:hypothetical protein